MRYHLDTNIIGIVGKPQPSEFCRKIAERIS